MEVTEAINFMDNLAHERGRSARAILEEAACLILAGQVTDRIEFADHRTLKRIAKKINFRLSDPQYLEDARRKGCDKEVITAFFNKFGSLFDRDPRLIFNINEIMLDSRNEFQVLVKRGRFPLKKAAKQPLHLTRVFCFHG
jgi:hypothetical protein